jgi:hypothetical protein
MSSPKFWIPFLVVLFLLTIFAIDLMLFIYIVVGIIALVRLILGRVRKEKIWINAVHKTNSIQTTPEMIDQKYDELVEISLIQSDEFIPELYEKIKMIFLTEDKIMEVINQENQGDRQENLEIQKVNFQHFIVVFNHLVKILKNPSDFSDSVRRIDEAKVKINHFHEQLQGLLQNYNEKGMRDFEIALRQMKESI